MANSVLDSKTINLTTNFMRFKIGDKVFVTGRGVSFDENGMGKGVQWENIWVEEMDTHLNLEFFVTDCCIDRGYELNYGYFFPSNVLKSV